MKNAAWFVAGIVTALILGFNINLNNRVSAIENFLNKAIQQQHQGQAARPPQTLVTK